MPHGQPINRLQLGPIVGHTDDHSTRIWIRVFDDSNLYSLRIIGVGNSRFISTEGSFEFGTAVSKAKGLRADWQYRYQVLRRGRVVPGATGSFRTMLPIGSMAEFQFVSLSCNSQNKLGVWQELKSFIDKSKPRFLLMMGDQVYMDEGDVDVWELHLDGTSSERRQALAHKYQENWERSPLREIMANIPTYMVWDDHESRDGWGSWAPDSPTMVERYPQGQRIFEVYNAFFEDARDVYWHFQMAHNPPVVPPNSFERKAMHYSFRCGGLMVLVLDSRGARDIWRKKEDYPILGKDQWLWIEDIFNNLSPEIHTLAIVTSTPIATMSPNSAGQLALGKVEPDVRFFRRGDRRRLDNLVGQGGTKLPGKTRVGEFINEKILEKMLFKARTKIDEVRDQWSHHFSRREQEILIRKVGEARRKNRIGGNPREAIFLGGDIHIGGIFEINVSKPSFSANCVVTSGISQVGRKAIDSIVTVDQTFQVAPGIKVKQRQLVQKYNFGVIQIIPTGGKPLVVPTIFHKGMSSAWIGQLGG